MKLDHIAFPKQSSKEKINLISFYLEHSFVNESIIKFNLELSSNQ